MIMAFTLAPFNWLYTYRRDSSKFWIGFSLFMLGMLLILWGVGEVLIFGVWVWAIVDSLVKPDVFYRQYPSR